MTDTTSVIREKRGQAFWITINRPDKRNAINGDVVAGIARGYREAHDDKDVRVIVLTGAGDKAFCAGADLQNSGAAFAMDFSRPNVDYADLLRLSQNATKPAIARVGGVCMAGGMGLLCMTDMAVAADHVIFGLPEVKVGVFPMQVLSLLQSIAPRRLVSEWSLTGEPFDAQTLATYFRALDFSLGERQIAGVREFARRAAARGEVPALGAEGPLFAEV